MKKVLLLEPSQSFAQFLTYILSRLGYEVIHLKSSDKVLDDIENMMPDFIITEIAIPNMGGIQFCEQIRTIDAVSNVPVAIISIDGSIETRQLAQQAGCVDYLTKPITVRAIHKLMQRHLPFAHKRHNIRAKMAVTAAVNDAVQHQELKTFTIGEGGLYLQTERPYKVGSHLDIQLPLPSLRKPLHVRGEVIYIMETNGRELPKGMGIKFIGLDLNAETLLRHYLESYLSNFLPESPI